ncbi:hypothetical protein CSAL01_04892 [Colletotrichum salicis]|uniref:Uncharacterized protein n=1 Tax=Colletotrichum salicis TaxID=1209931 RepID=A0A135T2N9_9PEZI|nr:hypothetical protein CSAL01_04892 [Colletotrichum salicis]
MSGRGRFIDPMESYLNPSPQCPIMARRIQEIHRAAHATNDSHPHEADTYYPRSGPAPGPVIYVRFECIPYRMAIACNDIWQTLGSATESYIGCNRTKGLWDTAFAGGWTTAHPVGDLPQPGPRDDDAVMVRCGVWRKDLPDISVNRHRPPRKPPKRRPRLGQVHPRYTPLKVRFTFCDSWGQDAPEGSINYDGDGNIRTHIFLARAARLFDEHERSHLEKYNQELAVYMVRRRLQYWVSDGCLRTGGGAHGKEAAITVVMLPGDDEELKGRFEDFIGARASLEKMAAVWGILEEVRYVQ